MSSLRKERKMRKMHGLMMTEKNILLHIEAGKLIGIELLDHIILGDNRYISLKESGYAF